MTKKINEKITEKIDLLFLEKPKQQKVNLKECIENIKSFKTPLDDQIRRIKEIENIMQHDLCRLSNLNTQIASLNSQTSDLEIKMHNKTKLYNELKELLMKVEVKSKYFVILEELEISEDNIEKFEEAIFKSEILQEKLKLEVIKERNEDCEKYRKIFKRRFLSFFKNLLKELILKTLKEKKNKSDIKLNTIIYDSLRKFKGLFIDKINLRDVYTLEVGKLYYSNFRFFFRALTDIFKEQFGSLDEIFSTILLICKCEIEFLYDIFLKEDEISLAGEVNGIFGEALPLFFIFLEEIYIFNEFETLKQIKNIILKNNQTQTNNLEKQTQTNNLEREKNKSEKLEKEKKQIKEINENRTKILKDLEEKYNNLEISFKKKLIKNFEKTKKVEWSKKVIEFHKFMKNEKEKDELMDFAFDSILHFETKVVSKEILLIKKYVCLDVLELKKKPETRNLFNKLEKALIECLIERKYSLLDKIFEELKKIKIDNKNVYEEIKEVFKEFVKNDKKFDKSRIPKWIFD